MKFIILPITAVFMIVFMNIFSLLFGFSYIDVVLYMYSKQNQVSHKRVARRVRSEIKKILFTFCTMCKTVN